MVGKRDWKRPLARPTSRWGTIGIDLREKGWKIVDWMPVAQDRDQ